MDFDPRRLGKSPEVAFLTGVYPDFISYVDAELRYQFVNDAYVEATGRTREQLLGRTIDEVWGDQAGGPTANVTRCLAGESYVIEMPFRGGHYLTTYAPHRDDGGVIRGALVFSRDVSELHASRLALLQNEKMASIGRLVAGLMHELNTPLGVVRSNVDLLGRGVARVLEDPTAATKTLGKLAGVIEATGPAIERMVGALEGLRRFTRLDEPDQQMVDVREGLDDTIAAMGHGWRAEVELVRDFGDVPAIEARPAELNQVYMHLLRNALDAIEGEGSITVRTAERGDRVEVEVSDSGVGIAPDRLAGLFEPQFSTGAGRVRAGLGLFISHDIVQRHGGRLEVTSTPGEGSRFTISLPSR